ncbi:hypothetical protein M885DRAFT_581351 [Pelagophyceae sp. CCMP2097]|nr:hypothetical protein M885DRAFT_581351 [Pelagophyceae sp. CCMP2097]
MRRGRSLKSRLIATQERALVDVGQPAAPAVTPEAARSKFEIATQKRKRGSEVAEETPEAKRLKMTSEEDLGVFDSDDDD